MTEVTRISPAHRPIAAVVRPPGSKSLSNRALPIAAVARGTSHVSGVLVSDDTSRMIEGLRGLGVHVETVPAAAKGCIDVTVTGAGGPLPARATSTFVGNAGTVARFLPPLVACGAGEHHFDGVPRMRERPIGPLLSALRGLGAEVVEHGVAGAFPFTLRAHGLRGGALQLDASASSQLASGLLLAAPLMADGLTLELQGTLVSEPYLDMTVRVMKDFGARVDRTTPRHFTCAPGEYVACHYDVEPDASAASYFFAAAAITGGRVVVQGLGLDSPQGDLELVEILRRMGCHVDRGQHHTTVQGPPRGELRGIDVDMRDVSDVAQTLAVVAPFCSSPVHIRGIGFIRAKETDRVGAPVRELQRLGVHAVEHDDGMTIHPSEVRPGRVATYEDHRMAMSFAVLGLVVDGIEIEDPGCTAKTYPGFFDDLAAVARDAGQTGSSA